jgi:hypothetical protein
MTVSPVRERRYKSAMKVTFKDFTFIFISIYKRYKLFNYVNSKQLFINFQILKINYYKRENKL